MRAFLLGLLIGSLIVSVIATMAQSNDRRETISLGIADLYLGMTEDVAIKELAESGYNIRKHEPPRGLRDKGVTSMWIVDEKGEKSPSLGVILFRSGKLDSAKKYLFQEGDEVEFGRQLYFAMQDLELEGNSHCIIETESTETPEYAGKTGKLRCGKKTILIELQKLQKYGESVQLNEELDTRPF
jgi:hypothetical protein